MSSRPAGMLSALLSRLTDFSRWLALAGTAVLIALVVLKVADVALRYLANAPIFGAQDLVELGLVLVVFLSLPYCGRTGGHVAVDILVARAGPGPARAIALTGRAAAFAVFALIAWRCALSALSAADFGAASNILIVPHAPFYGVISGSAALYCLILAVEAVVALRHGVEAAAPARR